jgi:hypothetical protein
VNTSNNAAWPALMAEGNIYISEDAPNALEIKATMVTNGMFKALGPPRYSGSLNIKGGIVAGEGIQVGNIYANQRNYSYQAPDPTLPLPFSTQVLYYKVINGKFSY